jgi:5-methylcytosine-specific restriction endonuclease McrA
MILERAVNCCEKCGLRNYSIVSTPDRELIKECESYSEARKDLEFCHTSDRCDGFIIIVLTISHTDHFLLNNDPCNLRALCQKCHNSHDAIYRAAKRKLRRQKALEVIAPSLPLVTSIISKI